MIIKHLYKNSSDFFQYYLVCFFCFFFTFILQSTIWQICCTLSEGKFFVTSDNRHPFFNAVVTPLCKAASYEPRIAMLGIWGDTWLTRGKYGIYVAVRGSYGGSTWHLEEILPRKISTSYCRVSYVTVMRIPSLVLRNTWHYMIIRCRKFWFFDTYAKVWPQH